MRSGVAVSAQSQCLGADEQTLQRAGVQARPCALCVLVFKHQHAHSVCIPFKRDAKEPPALVQPYVLVELPLYGNEYIHISSTETLVYDHYLSQYREEYRVFWTK